jgi:hypothetical protein
MEGDVRMLRGEMKGVRVLDGVWMSGVELSGT